MPDEETPLLGDFYDEHGTNIHRQFCLLVGIPPSNIKKGQRLPPASTSTLYGRAIEKRDAQNTTYIFTATLSNTLLLSEVVIGAALTALGASESSHILITIFGALNTVIAGLVAYLKSRGQPMRAKMFRDDLDRVVDEIENSETMWLGISRGIHGYDEIAIDDSVSVRSEIARLTRLYDKAVRSNTMNDPDMYMDAHDEGGSAALRARPAQPAAIQAPPVPVAAAGDSAAVAIPTPAAVAADPDQAPASAPPKPKEDSTKDDSKKEDADAKHGAGEQSPDSLKDSGYVDVPGANSEGSEGGKAANGGSKKPAESADASPATKK